MKKIAVLMYYMNCGGVEIALVNLLKNIPPNLFKIDLYLVETKGEFLNRVPDYVNLKEMPIFIRENYGFRAWNTSCFAEINKNGGTFYI